MTCTPKSHGNFAGRIFSYSSGSREPLRRLLAFQGEILPDIVNRQEITTHFTAKRHHHLCNYVDCWNKKSCVVSQAPPVYFEYYINLPCLAGTPTRARKYGRTSMVDPFDPLTAVLLIWGTAAYASCKVL